MSEYNRWYIYRKQLKSGSTQERRLKQPMLFPWATGWQLMGIIDLTVKKDK